MKTNKKKTKASWSYYPYDFQPEAKPNQLVYLAISVAVVLATFITLILI